MFEQLFTDLRSHRDHYRSRARRRLYLVRTRSEDRLHDLRAATLSRVGDWLHSLEEKVQGELTRVTETGIESYDTLRAKEAISAVAGVETRAQLVRIHRYESAHKERKTVLAAVEERLEALIPEVVALPEPEQPEALEDTGDVRVETAEAA